MTFDEWWKAGGSEWYPEISIEAARYIWLRAQEAKK